MSSIMIREGKKGRSYRFTHAMGYDEKGNQRTPITYTWRVPKGITKTEEKKQLNEELRAFESRVSRGISTKETLFKDMSEKYLKDAEKSHKPGTVSGIRYRLKPANEYLGNLQIQSITRQDIRGYIESLQEPRKRISKNKQGKKITKEYRLSPVTIRGYFKAVSIVLTYACENDLLETNVCCGKGIRLPVASSKKLKLLEREEVMQILRAIDHCAPLVYRTLFSLLIVTGARKGELLGLRWEDIDFDNNQISIAESSIYVPGKGIIFQSPKNESSVRTLIIDSSVISILKTYKTKQAENKLKLGALWQSNPNNPSEHYCENHDKCNKQCTGFCNHNCKMFKASNRIFTFDNGVPLSPQGLTRWLHRFSEKHNLPKSDIHTFRHTVVSHLYAQGEALTTIAGFVGHKSVKTTQSIYSHALKEKEQSCSSKLASSFKINNTN